MTDSDPAGGACNCCPSITDEPVVGVVEIDAGGKGGLIRRGVKVGVVIVGKVAGGV
jgi:hypothetical protein